MDRALGSQSLREFLELAWPLIEPARPFIPNWHIDAICDHLQAVTNREIRRLVINVPPGTSKSVTCSVAWPAWTWTHTPDAKWITGSYSGLISRRDALKSRRILESDWFRERWGHLWEAREDDWSSIRYSNTRAGFRLAVTVGGAVTGEHADHQLVDDPIKPLDARGARVDSVALQTCIEWWDETMATRIVDAQTATRTILMQRLHDRDLAGHVLGGGDYVHLNLPMRYEPQCVIVVPHKCTLPKTDKPSVETEPTPLGYRDPREEGELLWEKRFPESVQKERKKEMGSRGVAAQDQQRPMPSGGGIFKRDWVQYWKVHPRAYGVLEIQSWDCSFKGWDDSDYVAGQVWARKGADFYLIDQVHAQMSFSATCKAIESLSGKHKRAIRKLIEDKANGPAVISHLEDTVPGLKPVNPQGGKLARAMAVEPLWEAGNVYLPHPDIAPWVHDFIDELVGFSGEQGRPDDQVDAMTQALVYLHSKVANNYRKAMEQVR
jgi:predicted phage terminase large subunit-like protein